MNLLDALNSRESIFALGLLDAAAPRPVRSSLGGGLLSALGGAQQWQQSQDDRATAKAQRELQAQLIQAQIGETQAQSAQRQAQIEAAQRQAQEEQKFMQALLPRSATAAEALQGGGGPTPANAARMGQVQMPDWQALALQFPKQFDQIQKLAGAGNLGKNEVARTVEVMGPDGPMTMQFDKFGAPVGQGLAKPFELKFQDLGGVVSARNPYSGAAVGDGIKKTVTPDALLSAETARRGQNMVDARSREANTNQALMGRIPAGYRMTADGNLEAIPGGPADIKAGELGAKTEQRRAMAEQSAKSVLNTVQDAKSLVGVTTAGLGSWATVLPATDARNLAAKLETIKANLGFDRLQAMREASPTGGALGAVAVQELVALQSTVSSLDQGQSPAQLRRSLDKIETHYNNWLKTVTPGAKSTGGASGGWDKPGGGAQSLDDLLRKYGGN